MTRAQTLRCDTSQVMKALSDLDAALESFPEVRQALIDLLDSGEQLFRIDGDCLSAPGTDELLVSIHPSNALLGFLSAAGAGNVDLSIFEHATSPFGFADVITTQERMQ